MTSLFRPIRFTSTAAACLAALVASGAPAQRSLPTAAPYAESADARAAMLRAQAQQKAAEARSALLEKDAARASAALERTEAKAAALAARIQQSEAGLAAAEAKLQIVERSRRAVRERLAQRQRPLVELTAALQNLSRRPPALSLLRPGSVREMVYLRAMLASTMPEVRRRTAGLRADIARLRRLESEQRATILDFRKGSAELDIRRRELAALESRQGLQSRAKAGVAAREADRALALAEEARDLDGLMDRLDAAAGLRVRLAALPGPLMRPARGEEARIENEAQAPPASTLSRPPEAYQLPAIGPVIAGFGSFSDAGVRSNGLTLAPRPSAQIVAPGAGRVAFAGSYRGYGRIVIIEHEGGWTSLITGMARVDARVGQVLRGGAPLGIAGVDRPQVTLELRRDGETVNPLEYL